jgi:hypothetical protein
MTTRQNEAKIIAEACTTQLDLKNATLSEEYFYQSLPLCIIDSVFSIGVRYESTRKVVINYCDHFNLKRIRTTGEQYPDINEQESIDEFIKKIETIGIEAFTQDIFKNKQRTSTRNGILKTEAVYKFAKELQKHDVHYLQNIEKIVLNEQFEKAIKSIPGQTSGISLAYFFMLAGSDNLIKPDRMILRFLENTIHRTVTLQQAQELLEETVKLLKEEYPTLSPRLLDHEIWKAVRDKNQDTMLT